MLFVVSEALEYCAQVIAVVTYAISELYQMFCL